MPITVPIPITPLVEGTLPAAGGVAGQQVTPIDFSALGRDIRGWWNSPAVTLIRGTVDNTVRQAADATFGAASRATSPSVVVSPTRRTSSGSYEAPTDAIAVSAPVYMAEADSTKPKGRGRPPKEKTKKEGTKRTAGTKRTGTTPPGKEPKRPEGNVGKYFWETSTNSPKSSWFGRQARNYLIRVPAYTGIAAPTFDFFGNLVGAAGESENIEHEWIWPLTEARFTPERGVLKLVRQKYRTKGPNEEVLDDPAMRTSEMDKGEQLPTEPDVVVPQSPLRKGVNIDSIDAISYNRPYVPKSGE